MRLISASSGQLLTQWSPAAAAANAGSSSITLAAASPCQVLVASGGGKVWVLEVTEGGQLHEVGAVVMDAEVACLDITPVGERYLCHITVVQQCHSSVAMVLKMMLEVAEGGQLQEVGAVVMDADVACLDITPVGERHTCFVT